MAQPITLLRWACVFHTLSGRFLWFFFPPVIIDISLGSFLFYRWSLSAGMNGQTSFPSVSKYMWMTTLTPKNDVISSQALLHLLLTHDWQFTPYEKGVMTMAAYQNSRNQRDVRKDWGIWILSSDKDIRCLKWSTGDCDCTRWMKGYRFIKGDEEVK